MLSDDRRIQAPKALLWATIILCVNPWVVVLQPVKDGNPGALKAAQQTVALGPLAYEELTLEWFLKFDW